MLEVGGVRAKPRLGYPAWPVFKYRTICILECLKFHQRFIYRSRTDGLAKEVHGHSYCHGGDGVGLLCFKTYYNCPSS